MAIETRSIGSNSRYYSTITLWEADLDDTGEYSSGDTALGECYNDSEFNENYIAIVGGATSGLSVVQLSVASGERHDGSRTGAFFNGNQNRCIGLQAAASNQTVIAEWLRFKENAFGTSSNGVCWLAEQDDTATNSLRNIFIQDTTMAGSSAAIANSFNTDGTLNVLNNIIVGITNSTNDPRNVYGMNLQDASHVAINIMNNTVHDVVNGSSSNNGAAYGIFVEDNALYDVKNNLVTDTDHENGAATIKDIQFDGTNPDSDYNCTSDDTADDGGGSNNTISITSSDQYVSTTSGSEDLQLKSGADAIDAGTDLGTTPDGVELDILAYDRDANGVIWDCGAHEFATAAVIELDYLAKIRLLRRRFKPPYFK